MHAVQLFDATLIPIERDKKNRHCMIMISHQSSNTQQRTVRRLLYAVLESLAIFEEKKEREQRERKLLSRERLTEEGMAKPLPSVQSQKGVV